MSLILPLAINAAVIYDPIPSTVNGTINRIYAPSSGTYKILAGRFTEIDGSPRASCAKLASSVYPLSLDATFVPSGITELTDLIPFGSNYLACGENSITATPSVFALDGTDGSNVAGFVPPSIVASSTNRLTSIGTVTNADTSTGIIIGGIFTKLGTINRTNLAKLTSTGSVDTTFSCTINNYPTKIAAYTDAFAENRVLISGLFSNVKSNTRRGIVKINKDNGNVISGFNANTAVGTGGYVNDFAVNPVNKNITIVGSLIGGRFVKQIASSTGDDTGVFIFSNSTITSETLYPPNAVVLDADNKVYVDFTIYDSISDNSFARLYRLNTDGSIDTTFNASDTAGYVTIEHTNSNIIPTIKDIVIDNDGRILIGGLFDTVRATTRNNFAVLNTNGTLFS